MRESVDIVFYSAGLAPLLAPGEGRPVGGGELQVMLLARELSARGTRVAVACERGSTPLPDRIEEIAIASHTAARPGQLGHAAANLSGVCRALAGLRTPLIVQHAAGATTLYAALAAKLLQRRFVYWAAGLMDFEFERHAHSPRAASAFVRGARLADQIVVHNEEQARACQSRMDTPGTIIPYIAEPATPRTLPGEYFVWVGRLDPVKRPHDFIELARRLPSLSFKMIAVPSSEHSNSMLADFERAVADTPNLELLAPRPHGEMGPLLSGAVAVVSTSESEGTPNVLLEAWARGVPALALHYDPGGVISRERLGHFANGSMDSLVRATEEMWLGRGEDDGLVERCRNWIHSQHSPAAVAARWQAEVLDG